MKPLLLASIIFLTSWKGIAPDLLPYKNLVWADYRGKPDYSKKDIAAYTVWEWDYRADENNGVFTFSVKSYFSTQDSWTKTNSPYVLSHEQIHLAISEVYCRQLRKALTAISGCTNCKSAADSMYDISFAACSKEQSDYDSATDRGLDHPKQTAWNNKIQKLLKQ